LKKRGFTGSRLFISLLALVLIVSFLFSACAKATSTTTQTSTTTTQTSTTTTKTSTTTTTTTAAQKVLKIGAVIDLTGSRGLGGKKWLDLAAKLYNDAGGWKIGNDTYKVQMVIYDSQGNVTTAKDELTRLVLNDGCKFIVSWSITGNADVDATVTEPNKVIVINEDLTNQAVNPKYQYFFPCGNFFQNADIYKICVDTVKKGVKSYLSVKPDNQVGRVMDPAINAAWKLASPSIDYKGTVWVPATTIDWGPVATKIKSYNADCVDIIYLGFIPNSIPNTYRALSDVGYKGIILPGLMTQYVLDSLVGFVGKAAVEAGEVPGADAYTWQQEPHQRALMDAYVKEYGSWSSDGNMMSFQILEAAINATQSVDTDVIKAYMDNSPAPVQLPGGLQQYFARPELGNNRTISGCTSGQLGVIRDGKLVGSGTFTTTKDHYLFTIKTKNLIDIFKVYWAQYGYPKFPAAEKGMETFKYTDLGITGQD
jgi:branched-chain amino acid transport system substrate-binding protein